MLTVEVHRCGSEMHVAGDVIGTSLYYLIIWNLFFEVHLSFLL